MLQAAFMPPVFAQTTLVESIGYNPGSDVPVFQKPIGQAGTFAPGTNPFLPLESCALLRFSTDQRTSKNHPIYLFKYIHNQQADDTTHHELLRNGLRSSWQQFGDGLVAGYNDGTNDRTLCGPYGAVAQSAFCEQYVTHRDFPA